MGAALAYSRSDAVSTPSTPSKRRKNRAPAAIAQVKGIKQLPHIGPICGIYFLCEGNEVVYVGQSVDIVSRITTHYREKSKEFDRAFWIPVSQSELNEVEAAFILHLRPRLHGYRKGTSTIVTPVKLDCPNAILASFGYEIAGVSPEDVGLVPKSSWKQDGFRMGLIWLGRGRCKALIRLGAKWVDAGDYRNLFKAIEGCRSHIALL